MACRFVPAVVAFATVLAFFASPRGLRAQAEPIATQDEIQQLYNEGKFPVVLQKLPRILALKGAASKPYDRHALFRMKGESHLRVKQAVPASQAFHDAADETAEATPKAVDLATEYLIKKCPPLVLAYTPKGKDRAKAGPIDIVEAENRKLALAALFEDELAAAQPKVKAARDAKQLSRILEVLPAIRGVRSLEVASSGTDAQTKKLLGDLATHTQNLMSEAVRSMGKDTDAIEKIANEWLAYDNITADPNSRTGTRTERRWKRRGPNTRDQRALQDTSDTCDRIAPACRDLAEAMGTGDKEFGAIRLEAERVGRKASTILRDDYTRSVSTPPR